MSNFSKILLGTFIALGVIVGSAFTTKAREDIPPTPPIERIVLKGDGGGRLQDYIEAFTALKASNLGVKVDGLCASACTLVTFPDFGLDYCVTDKAVLGIHHPFLMNPDGKIAYTAPAAQRAQVIWSEVFYSKYPKWIRDYIDLKGGAPDVYKGASPNDMLEVPFDELKKHTQVCS